MNFLISINKKVVSWHSITQQFSPQSLLSTVLSCSDNDFFYGFSV